MTGHPNMAVVEAADATDRDALLDAVYPDEGSTYVRALRGEVPRFFQEPVESGRHPANGVGDSSREPRSGVGICPTLTPCDDVGLYEKLSGALIVITVKDHRVTSGLGRIVSEVHLEHGYSTRLLRVGVKDTFTHGGIPGYLENFYGIGGKRYQDYRSGCAGTG